MNTKSITGMGLVLALSACSSNSPTPSNGSNNKGTAGAGGSVGAAPGTGGGTSTGGVGGGNTVGGTGGSVTSSTGGASTGGTGVSGGSAGSGTGGTAGPGSGGSALGGGGAMTGMGMGGQATGMGGQSTGVAGMNTAGTGASAGGASTTGVTVQLAQTDQTIEGFGLNDVWQPLPSNMVNTFFSPTSGIGMTILRTGMSVSGTGSSTAASYNSGETASIAAVKSAAGKDAKIIGSVWTATSDCRDSNNTDPVQSSYGGHLKSSCYDTFGSAIAGWAQTNGLYAMSVANEPDFVSCGTTDPCNGDYDSMVFTATEMVAWVKSVGPKLQANNVKVIAAEPSEWNHMWSNVSAGPDSSGKNSSDPLGCGCFGMTLTATGCASKCSTGGGYDYGHYLAADSTAWMDFDIVGLHEYDSQQGYAWPSDVTAAKKEVWVTEMAGVKFWPQTGPSSDIANGIAVAGWIHSALVTGNASAWVWWWYQPLSSTTNDNEGILLQDGTDTKRHYTIGNFSKFVRPGYKRVEVTGNSNTNLLISAYTGSSTVVVVAINQGTADATVPIAIAGGTAPASCAPAVTSATTTSANALQLGTAVPVTGGSFSAALAASTVTTFVCQ